MPQKDSSFIECAETKEISGHDVHVHKEMAMELEAGTAVRINMCLNRDGFPKAVTTDHFDPDCLPASSDPTIQRFADVAAAGDGAKRKGGFGRGRQGLFGCIAQSLEGHGSIVANVPNSTS